MSNKHIFIVEELHGITPTETVDNLIGGLLIVVVITGIVGNIPAIIYFWKKRRNTLPDLLYTIIVITDICTSAITITVIPSLFNSRLPTLFHSFPLCAAFAVLFNHAQRFSVHMVMMLSTTRAIRMSFPFSEISKKGVIAACICFEIFWMVVEGSLLGSGRLKVFYANQGAFCGMGPVDDGKAWNAYMAIFLIWVISSMIVVVLSLIFSLRTIATRRNSSLHRIIRRRPMEASITIALFTTIFLLCFLPLFVIQTSTSIAYFLNTHELLEKSGVYSWYGLLIAHIVLTSFNAAANPCLYVARMNSYKSWLFKSVGRYKRLLRSFSIVDQPTPV